VTGCAAANAGEAAANIAKPAVEDRRTGLKRRMMSPL
jgi:hypothetical protein